MIAQWMRRGQPFASDEKMSVVTLVVSQGAPSPRLWNDAIRTACKRRSPRHGTLSSLNVVPEDLAIPAATVTTMKGEPKVIDYLKAGLRHELTAVNQYWLHYRLLDHWG